VKLNNIDIDTTLKKVRKEKGIKKAGGQKGQVGVE